MSAPKEPFACKYCIYFDAGTCHRLAPTSAPSLTRWPPVRDDDWCGEGASSTSLTPILDEGTMMVEMPGQRQKREKYRKTVEEITRLVVEREQRKVAVRAAAKAAKAMVADSRKKTPR